MKDTRGWINKGTKENVEFRQAVHVILNAISNTPELSSNMVIKGGLLLAVKYESDRFTKDIDFSTNKSLDEIGLDYVVNNLKKGLIESVEELQYDLDCRIQTYKIMPASIENPKFPSIKINVGYAYRGTKKHKKLIDGKCPTIVGIDYSLNEPLINIEDIDIGLTRKLIAYTAIDLIAEKIRSLLQQVERDRYRRQDVYDLNNLLEICKDINSDEQNMVIESLKIKSESRGIIVNKDSLDNIEVRERAKKDYHTLDDEVESELPDFDELYEKLVKYYKNLPW